MDEMNISDDENFLNVIQLQKNYNEEYDESDSEYDENFGEDIDPIKDTEHKPDRSSRYHPYIRRDSSVISHPLNDTEIEFGIKLSQALHEIAVNIVKDDITNVFSNRRLLASMILEENDLSSITETQPSQDQDPNVQNKINQIRIYENTFFHSKIEYMFNQFKKFNSFNKTQVYGNFNIEIKLIVSELKIKFIIEIKYKNNVIFHVSLFINKNENDIYQISSIHITKEDSILSPHLSENKYVFIKLKNLFIIFFDYAEGNILKFIGYILQLLSNIFFIEEEASEEIRKVSSKKINKFVYDICKKSIRQYGKIISGGRSGRINKNKTIKEKPKTAKVLTKVTKEKPKTAKVVTKVTKVTKEKPKTAKVVNKVTKEKPKTPKVVNKITKEKPKTAKVVNKVTKEKPKTAKVVTKVTKEKPKTPKVVTKVTKATKVTKVTK